MAKNLDFGKLVLPPKPEVIVKKAEVATPESAVEKAVETIHNSAPKKELASPPAKETKKEAAAKPAPLAAPKDAPRQAPIAESAIPTEEIKKISLDLPMNVYKTMKIHTFSRAMTMKDYILDLITEDMRKKGIR
jgi:hypothetical protein